MTWVLLLYDAAGRTLQETLPGGVTNNYQYTVTANTVTETRMTDGNGNVTTYRFNGLGFPVKTIDALGRTFSADIDYATNLTLSSTDPVGRTSVVDPAGNTTLIEYDQTWNQPTRITNALGFTTTLTYTAQGQLASITDSLNHTTRFGYDAQGNLIRTSDALGNVAQARYDTANRLIEAINPKGRSTTYTYDALDRLLKRSDALGGTTQVSYDANDNPLTVVDANTHAIETNVYDLRNRLTSRTDATGKPTTYQYDANDNLVQATDRKGQVTTLQYDALNRPSQISDADGRITQYSYDLAGNLAHIADSQSGDIVLSYDPLNRLTRIITNQGSVTYQYDALGRRTQRTLDGGDPTDYTYDKANRIKTLTYRGKTVVYSYDAAGRLIQKTLPNGVAATYQYDAANRLTGLIYTKPDTTILTALTYTYDANGNRISQNLNAPTDTPFSATYDANGNLVQRQSATGTVTYTWDARNRLTGISGPSGTASFKYDALGRRTEKTVNGQTVQYLYDGDQAIAELQGSAIGATYLTGLQIDEVLARYSASGDRTLIADALGSVLAQTDGAGAVQTQYSYSPYGETQTSGTDDGNPVQYTGRENDQSGLYYYRARYYDPQLKRFISEDPIGLGGGVNQYAYVGGNPISLIDPKGLWGFAGGFGGGYYLGFGGEANSGGFYSPDAGTSGAYTSTGTGYGYNAGLGVQMTLFLGKGTCSFQGKSKYYGITVFGWGLGITTGDGGVGGVTSISVTGGVGAPLGAQGGTSNTITY
ncbi:MAG: RHS repeat-associated core domain-containing protein [Sulfuriferula sp.]